MCSGDPDLEEAAPIPVVPTEVAETCRVVSKPELGPGLPVGAVTGPISNEDPWQRPGKLAQHRPRLRSILTPLYKASKPNEW